LAWDKVSVKTNAALRLLQGDWQKFWRPWNLPQRARSSFWKR